MSNITPLPRPKKTWKSSYLPRVEREAASRAIRKLCRNPSNDNKATLLKVLKTALLRYQAAFTISIITVATIVLAASRFI